MLASVEQVLLAARLHVAEWTLYDNACKAWATDNTTRLWHPWTAWKIRYVPMMEGKVSMLFNQDMDSLFNQDMDSISIISNLQDAFIQSIVVADDVDKIPPGMHTQHCFLAINSDGQMAHIVTGSFLDARKIEFTEPDIESVLLFHRSYLAGKFVVNVPGRCAIGTDDLSPIPSPRPMDWYERMDHIDLSPISSWDLERYLRKTKPEDLATATVEDVLENKRFD